MGAGEARGWRSRLHPAAQPHGHPAWTWAARGSARSPGPTSLPEGAADPQHRPRTRCLPRAGPHTSVHHSKDSRSVPAFIGCSGRAHSVCRTPRRVPPYAGRGASGRSRWGGAYQGRRLLGRQRRRGAPRGVQTRRDSGERQQVPPGFTRYKQTCAGAGAGSGGALLNKGRPGTAPEARQGVLGG